MTGRAAPLLVVLALLYASDTVGGLYVLEYTGPGGA